jgi:hypothetical protein
MTTYFKSTLLVVTFWFSLGANAYDPFEVKLRTTYPKTMRNVGQAVKFVIEPFEYTLVTNTRYTQGAAKIASMPITPMARTTRTMPVYDAIQALIGPNNTILVDHENKLVSFREGVSDEK